jgi:hypothetical protein
MGFADGTLAPKGARLSHLPTDFDGGQLELMQGATTVYLRSNHRDEDPPYIYRLS